MTEPYYTDINILLHVVTARKRSCFYRPKRSWGKVIFSQACVILFTGGGLPQCMLGYHPQSRHPPWTRHPPSTDTPMGADTPRPGTPQSRHPPGPGTPPDQAPPQTRHPPGSRPPSTEHAGRYGQRTGGMHPTGMQSCYTCLSVTVFTGGWSASKGSASGGCIWGVCIQGVWTAPSPIGYYGIRSTSGQDASYWNAFLFPCCLWIFKTGYEAIY